MDIEKTINDMSSNYLNVKRLSYSHNKGLFNCAKNNAQELYQKFYQDIEKIVVDKLNIHMSEVYNDFLSFVKELDRLPPVKIYMRMNNFEKHDLDIVFEQDQYRRSNVCISSTDKTSPYPLTHVFTSVTRYRFDDENICEAYHAHFMSYLIINRDPSAMIHQKLKNWMLDVAPYHDGVVKLSSIYRDLEQLRWHCPSEIDLRLHNMLIPENINKMDRDWIKEFFTKHIK